MADKGLQRVMVGEGDKETTSPMPSTYRNTKRDSKRDVKRPIRKDRRK